MMLATTSSLSIGDKGAKRTLIGRSRAGDGTSFAIPELKWMFDCGALIQGWKPRILFLSHTHSDHAHCLTHIKNAESPTVIYLPVEAEPFVRSYLIAHQEMGDCMKESESQEGGKFETDYMLKATKPGEEIKFRQKGVEYVVRALEMTHRIPCLGYSIFKMNTILKKEYLGLPGREIGRLRKEGVEITTSVEEPFLCFLGDTTSAVFSSYPDILSQHKVVVVECSFIDDDSVKRAEKTMHMHWLDLEPHIANHPDTFFVLIHFSLKYSSLTLRKFFCQQQEKYRNIHPMIVDDEVEEQWNKAVVAEEDGAAHNKGMPRCMCKLCSDN